MRKHDKALQVLTTNLQGLVYGCSRFGCEVSGYFLCVT